MRDYVSMETHACTGNELFADSAIMATSSEGDQGAHGGVSDSIVTEFSSYEDFLDSQITPTDLYYLEVKIVVAMGF